MASAAVIAFHNANMADEKRRVALRIANGTKGSSPQIISYRHSHPSFKGLPHNSTGSRNAPFFVNTNQRGHPFDGIVGGVIKDYRFARELLDQRARSTNELAALKEGIPVPPATPSAMLTLSPEDSRVLELNQLLQTIQDIVEANALESLGATISSDLKSILRLFVALLPSFSESDLGDFTQYFEELVIQLDAAADNAPTPQSRAAVGQTRTFFTNLLSLIRGFMATSRRTDTGEVITESNMTKTDREKASLIRALVRQIFKTDISRLKQARAEPVPRRVAEVAAAEEGGDDDGLDGDEALDLGAQGGPQRVVAASLGAPGGGMETGLQAYRRSITNIRSTDYPALTLRQFSRITQEMISERASRAEIIAALEDANADAAEGQSARLMTSVREPGASALAAATSAAAAEEEEEGQAAAAVGPPRGPSQIVLARAFLADNSAAVQAAMRKNPDYAYRLFFNVMDVPKIPAGRPGAEYIPALTRRFKNYPVEAARDLNDFLMANPLPA
jgi:hypothetical protein